MRSHAAHTLRRRLLVALVSVAVAVVAIASMFDPARASSVVTPQAGPGGRIVFGHRGHRPVHELTALARAEVNGETTYLLGTDLDRPVQYGIDYDEVDWSDERIAGLARATRVLADSRATRSHDPVEIAASQAAMWHVTDGFELDADDARNDPRVVRRYLELVRSAEANPVPGAPAGGLAAEVTSPPPPPSSPVTVRLTGDAPGPWSIEVADPALVVHPTTADGVCDPTRSVSTVDGPAVVCVSSSSAAATGRIVVRSTPTPVDGGRAFHHANRRLLVTPNRTTAQSAVVVELAWDTDR